MHRPELSSAMMSKGNIHSRSANLKRYPVHGVLSAQPGSRSMFDTRSNRVTLRVDVSHTEHGHFMGVRGLNIKSLSEETNCIIHFAEINPKDAMRSNQVSISGEMENVEGCRVRIRELTPVIFRFEVPIPYSVLDTMSAFIQTVQKTYGVQVSFRPGSVPCFTKVLVKGCERELPKVKETTMVLITQMCGRLAEQFQVYMRMEISPQDHSLVFGLNKEYLKNIIMQTGADIKYVDGTDLNTPPNIRSNVVISGGIDNVYLARQQLIGRLPLRVSFDVPIKSLASTINNVNILANDFGVDIHTRCNPNNNNFVTVTIKGIEKNRINVYEARQQLIKMNYLGSELLTHFPVNNSGLDENAVLTKKHPFSEDYEICTDNSQSQAAMTNVRSTTCSFNKAVGAERKRSLFRTSYSPICRYE